jgi:hypothetical protein
LYNNSSNIKKWINCSICHTAYRRWRCIDFINWISLDRRQFKSDILSCHRHHHFPDTDLITNKTRFQFWVRASEQERERKKEEIGILNLFDSISPLLNLSHSVSFHLLKMQTRKQHFLLSKGINFPSKSLLICDDASWKFMPSHKHTFERLMRLIDDKDLQGYKNAETINKDLLNLF